jgi:hypothetical protein
MTGEQTVARFLNSDENLQIVTEGPGARCPSCGYPERHRVYEMVANSDVPVLIADGCPACETERRDVSQRCRECGEGKHGACNGTALVDEGHDVLEVDCICASGGHA